jgi:hypothetical protein
VLTPDSRVQSANPAFYALFHLCPGEVEGAHIYQLDQGNGIFRSCGPCSKRFCRRIPPSMIMR